MRSSRLLVGVLVLALGRCVAAAPPPPQPLSPAEELLRSKGLIKSGAYYLLDADAHLPEGLKRIRQAQRTIESNSRKRTSVLNDIDRADDVLAQNLAERARLQGLLRDSMPVDQYNRIVSQANACLARAKEAETYGGRCREDLKKIVDPTDDYISAVMETSDKMEAAAAQYEALAKDADVATAIATINKTAKPPVRLGPSAQFAQELKPTRMLRKSVESASIPLRMEGASPMVDVKLNGQVTVPMVVDSGANSVVVSAATADKLNLKPGPRDQAITATVAGGGKVEAHLMTLKTVTLGQFTVENVECLVLPPGPKDTENLLGVSFLQHFVYRMDLASSVLHMQQISGKPTSPIAVAKEAPETRPSAAATQAAGPTRAPQATQPAAAPPPAKLPEGWTELLGTMAGNTDRKEDGAIVLHDGEKIGSREMYKAPVTFKIVAMTTSTDLRIGCASDQIIFNWKPKPSELRIDGGPANGRHRAGAGAIPVNEWTTIQFEVLKDRMRVRVNGTIVQVWRANFGKMTFPLTIFPAEGSTVKVKSIGIFPGDPRATTEP